MNMTCRPERGVGGTTPGLAPTEVSRRRAQRERRAVAEPPLRTLMLHEHDWGPTVLPVRVGQVRSS